MTPEVQERPRYLRTAVAPRMLVLLVLLLAAAVVCARLGAWQLERAQLRGEAESRERVAELLAAEPEPLEEVIAPQEPFAADDVGRKVVVGGEFVPDQQLLVPGRAVDGRTGVLVLTPLRTDGALLPVVRGWVPTVGDAAALPPAPGGDVEVVGYLQAGEASGVALPPGQVEAISPAELVNRWGEPIYTAYLVVAQVEPPQGGDLVTVPPPTLAGGGLNLLNLTYALQWWIFAGFAVLIWVRMVRDEARAEVEPPDEPAGEAGTDARRAGEPARPVSGGPDRV